MTDELISGSTNPSARNAHNRPSPLRHSRIIQPHYANEQERAAVTDDPGGGSNDSGASRAARLAVNEGEEVMRTGSLYQGIGKLRESHRTVQQHTNTPRLAEEIKYGTARMGNTTSTDRDIYFFEDQVTIAERQRVLMAKTHPKTTARNPIQRRQLKTNIPQNTSLECYDVVLSRCADVWHGCSP